MRIRHNIPLRSNSAGAGEILKSKVASGFYGNATEVIRDAIRLMQIEEARVAAWHAAIAKGDEELKRGLGVAYTPATLEHIAQTAISDMHGGKPIDKDVLP